MRATLDLETAAGGRPINGEWAGLFCHYLLTRGIPLLLADADSSRRYRFDSEPPQTQGQGAGAAAVGDGVGLTAKHEGWELELQHVCLGGTLNYT